MNFIKTGYASIEKQLKKLKSFSTKPVQVQAGFKPNTSRYIPANNKYIAFSLLILFSLLPEMLFAQQAIQGDGYWFDLIRDFTNDVFIPVANILMICVTIGCFATAGIMAGLQNPRWKAYLYGAFICTFIWAAAATIYTVFRGNFTEVFEIV